MSYGRKCENPKCANPAMQGEKLCTTCTIEKWQREFAVQTCGHPLSDARGGPTTWYCVRCEAERKVAA